jgi:hypothetical protein
MAVLATDNFNRADSTDLGASWDVVPGESNCQIVANAVRAGVGGGADCSESYNGVTWPNDQYSQIVIVSLSDRFVGPVVRASTSANTLYLVECATTNIYLYKVVSASGTLLVNYSGTVSVGDIIRLEAQGTTLRVFQNGTQRISTTDTSIASGRAGIHINLPGSQFDTAVLDNWEGGDFSTGGGGPLFGKLINNPRIAGRLVL